MLHVQYDATIFGRTTISYGLQPSWKKYEKSSLNISSRELWCHHHHRRLPTSTKNKSEHVRELWWHHHPIRFDDVGLLYSRTSPDMSKSRLVIGRELWWHQHQRFADVGLFDSRPDMSKSRLLIGREFVSKTINRASQLKRIQLTFSRYRIHIVRTSIIAHHHHAAQVCLRRLSEDIHPRFRPTSSSWECSWEISTRV